MKNIANVKLKTFLMIFLLINLILQPISIYLYIVNVIDILSIIPHILAGIYLSFSFSIMINEFIFKIIFYGMLKGKLITNPSNKLFYIAYFIMLSIFYIYWFLFFILKNHDFTYPMSLIVLVSVIEIKYTYIISNGYLFCGFKVIPLDAVHWYKISKSRNSLTLRLKYQGNRSFSTVNSPKCIEELSKYFDTHSVVRRFNEKVS